MKLYENAQYISIPNYMLFSSLFAFLMHLFLLYVKIDVLSILYRPSSRMVKAALMPSTAALTMPPA